MTTILLEKIDLVKERTGASYELAAELLKEFDGNVVEAIIAFEKKYKKNEEFQVKSNNLVDKVKSLIKEGNVSRISIRHKGEVLLNIPVNIGVVAVVLAPYLAILSGIVAVVSSCTIVVERKKKSEKCEMEELD